MGKTCLNRFIKTCEVIVKGGVCQRDYNPNHRPNNYDCPNYHQIPFLEFTVVKVSLMEEAYIKIGEIIGKDGGLRSKILEKRVKELEKKQ